MRLARHPRTAGRVIDGRAMVVSIDQNRLFTLSPTATCIWEALAEPRSTSELAAGLCATFNVDQATALSDCSRFCDDLRERGLVVALP